MLDAPLILSMLGKISADDNLKYFSYFSQQMGFDISYKLSRTICMKCQISFSGKKIKKKIRKLSSIFWEKKK